MGREVVVAVTKGQEVKKKMKDIKLNLFCKNKISIFFRITLGIYLIMLFIAGSAVSATNYYVRHPDATPPGSNSNTGLSPDEAWATPSYAAQQVQEGDTVYVIDDGHVWNDEHVEFANSGTESNPITFEGHNGTPVLDGEDRTGKGIYINSKSCILIKNIEVTRYEYGVEVVGADHVTLDSITVTNLGTDGYSGFGVRLNDSDYCVIRNCNVTDARAENFRLLSSNYNLMEDCSAYGVETENAVDYYIVICYSHHNIVRNCLTQNKHPWSTSHCGHGIGIKDTYWNGTYNHGPHSFNNKIINCETHAHGEHLWVAHHCYDNEFINCTAYADNLNSYWWWNHGILIRDGAYRNTFKNIRVTGTRTGALFLDSDESPTVTTQSNNSILNCSFDVTDACIDIGHAENNVFRNCVITGANAVYYGHHGESNNSLSNSIVFGIPSLGKNDIIYSDFWNNGFSTPSGEGNIEKDPLFADPANGDFHLKSQYGRWNDSVWVCDPPSEHSPCIDKGDPDSDCSEEPQENGGRINMGAYGNTGEASLSGTPAPDTTPPAAATNLSAGNATSSSITLTWTAPGDDNNSGRASVYDVRYSVSAITASNWDSSTECSNETAPQTAGSAESFTVPGLSPDTTWHFALKTADENPNWSAVSNCSNAKTIEEIDKVFVSPNPYVKGKSGEEKINFSNLPKEATLRIYTISGKLVKEIKHSNTSDGGKEEWGISGIAGGVYIYTIISSSGKKEGKVSIVK